MRPLFLVTLLAAGGVIAPPAPLRAAEDFVANAADIIKSADWKTMESLAIDMEEFHFSPSEIRLKEGQPYRLELRNKGAKDHIFAAPEFFRAIATRKAQNQDGEIKAPYLLSVLVRAHGGRMDLYFIPAKKGSFAFYCTIEDFRQKGMEGKITVE